LITLGSSGKTINRSVSLTTFAKSPFPPIRGNMFTCYGQ
jgi:hypothetical protein